MTSRERVVTAVALHAPDPVPLNFSASACVLQRLYRDLGTSTRRQLPDRLHVDTVNFRGVVDPVYCRPIPGECTLPSGVKEHFWGWRTLENPML